MADPNDIVLLAIQKLVWGPSFACKIRQSTWAFEKQLIAQGEYWHAGQGTGKLRMSIQLGEDNQRSNVQQCCDGRVLWTVVDHSIFRTIDLDRVRYDIGVLGRRPSHLPEVDLYLAMGGQAEVLRTLYTRYRWHKIQAGTMDAVPVWQLIGTLRTAPAPITTRSPIDALWTDPLLVAAVPSDVRLTLSRDSATDLFPFRIEYFQKVNEQGKKGSNRPISILEYTEVRMPWAVNEEVFQAKPPEDVAQKDDETSRYSPPKPLAGTARPSRR